MPTPDKAALRQQLEDCHLDYPKLLGEVTPTKLRQRSASTAWTLGELLTHMADNYVRLPAEIDSARKGKDYLNPPAIMRPLIPTMNRIMAQRSARGQTLESLGRRYEQAHAAALVALDGIAENEWGLGAKYYGLGYRTIEKLFTTYISHYWEHAGHVRESLPASDAVRP